MVLGCLVLWLTGGVIFIFELSIVAVGKCYHLLQLEFMLPLKFHLATVKWLLILWVALVRFHWVLNFHWHSIQQQGHVRASSSVVRNVEARYEERQKLTNCPETKIRKLTSLSCHLKKRWSADGRRTYCNQPLINCFRKELKSVSKVKETAVQYVKTKTCQWLPKVLDRGAVLLTLQTGSFL